MKENKKKKTKMNAENVSMSFIWKMNFGKTYSVKQFQAENIPRRTIYDIIKHSDKLGHERKAGNVRIAKKSQKVRSPS